MALFVADASATLPWCFEDEATDWTEGLLERLGSGDRIVVPAHWPTEISNGMLMALRKGRIQSGRPELFRDQLSLLPVDVEEPLTSGLAKSVLALSVSHGLRVYDAVYLETS